LLLAQLTNVNGKQVPTSVTTSQPLSQLSIAQSSTQLPHVRLISVIGNQLLKKTAQADLFTGKVADITKGSWNIRHDHWTGN
jgi:hypothetical protein